MTDLPGVLAGVDRSRLVDRFGPSALVWCDGLQALVTSVAAEWRLTVTALLPGSANSVVFACASDHGIPLVLKLTPDSRIAAQEATALHLWAMSRHVVSLVDSDVDRGSLLLEFLQPGTRLSDDTDGWALDDVAPMLADLFAPPPVDNQPRLPDLRERVDVVFALAQRRLQRWNPGGDGIGKGLVQRSHALARDLAVGGEKRLVHGDLHPGNALRCGADRGIVAIDPRPCWGDRSFDTVDWVLADVTNQKSVRHRVQWLANNVAGIDPDRVWAWSRALAVIIAVSVLARRPGDASGEFLLRWAGDSTEATFR